MGRVPLFLGFMSRERPEVEQPGLKPAPSKPPWQGACGVEGKGHRSYLSVRGEVSALTHLHPLSVQRILEEAEPHPLPAALVQPHTGKLCWFLDEAAARLLTVPFEKHSTL